jgi:hypothetical protein
MGGVGKATVRAVARRPDMELVGVGVYSPEKAGLDAGTYVGIEPLGLAMTADIDALIALKPDCLTYSGVSDSRDPAMVARLARFLEAGINVTTPCCYGLIHPPSQRLDHRQMLEAATAKGNSSAHAVGLEPGFAQDLALLLTPMSDTVRTIRIQELWSYDRIPTAHTIFTTMGLGMPMDYQPLVAESAWCVAIMGGSMRKIAHRLGVEIEDFRWTFEKAPTSRTVEVAAGTIEAGTVGATRFQLIGMVDGREAIVIEHVNRIARDVAPEWPIAATDAVYRVIIEGRPDISCELVLGRPDDNEGSVATAMLMVNAIPYICEAPAGLLTAQDLPYSTPKHVFQ